jgi:integrase
MAVKKVQKLSKYGLPYGSGQIIHLKDGRNLSVRARKTKWDNIARKNVVVWERSFKTECEAVRALLEASGKPVEALKKESLTFEELYAEWMERPSGMAALSELSRKQMRSVFNAHCGSLVRMKFASITADDLQKVIDYCPSGYQTKNQIKVLLTHLYRLALSKEIVLTDKAANLYVGRDDEKKETMSFTNAEARRIIDLAETVQYGQIAKLMLFSGMRISEALSLKTDNIDLENRLFVNFGVKTKTSKSRKLPIHPEIFELVKSRSESGAKYIFEQESGKPVSGRAYHNFFSEHLRKAEVDKQHFGKSGTAAITHKCRHTFITKLYELDTEKLITKRLAGHANADVTDLYTHVGLEKLRAAVEKVRY